MASADAPAARAAGRSRPAPPPVEAEVARIALDPSPPERPPAPPSPEPWLGGRANRAASGSTLDDLLSAAWEGLREEATVDCPLCRGPMRPRLSAGAGVVGGRCATCASELA